MESTVVMEKNSYIFYKNFIDRILAMLLLILLLPIILITAILIKLTSRGSILYIQKRIGKDGKEFNMLKFRSMYVGYYNLMINKIDSGELNPLSFKDYSKEGYTKIGKYIRKSSIDELPQLINIIKGEMAIIGPRPLQKFEIDNYISSKDDNTAKISQRQSILPGLLCYWQVDKNKDTMNFFERIELDLKYVSDMSFKNDIKLLVLGIRKILYLNNN